MRNDSDEDDDFRVDLGHKVYAEILSRDDRWWGVYKRSEYLRTV